MATCKVDCYFQASSVIEIGIRCGISIKFRMGISERRWGDLGLALAVKEGPGRKVDTCVREWDSRSNLAKWLD
jgi:hypothetical protein